MFFIRIQSMTVEIIMVDDSNLHLRLIEVFVKAVGNYPHASPKYSAVVIKLELLDSTMTVVVGYSHV